MVPTEDPFSELDGDEVLKDEKVKLLNSQLRWKIPAQLKFVHPVLRPCLQNTYLPSLPNLT